MRFGLNAPLPASETVSEIVTTIDGMFDGWVPGGRVKLANGQVWEFMGGSPGIYRLDRPKVVITKGSWGGYFMRIGDLSQTPKVRRIS